MNRVRAFPRHLLEHSRLGPDPSLRRRRRRDRDLRLGRVAARAALARAACRRIASITIPQRVKLVAKHALGQARVLSQAYPGVMHATMFWGFLALFMGTVLATIDYDITLPLFGYKLLKGDFYLYYETVLDLFGLFFVVGLGMAVWRRFVAAAAPRRSRGALRLRAGAAVRHQRHRLRDGGVPPGGGEAVVGGRGRRSG